jgi:hypothetical protein
MKFAKSFSLTLAISSAFFAFTTNAAGFARSSGATSGIAAEFNAQFNGHPNKVGYNNNIPDRMFLESFPVDCRAPSRITNATFAITVKKLTQGANRGDNDGLGLWKGGAAQYSMHMWSPSDPPNTVKTIMLPIGALPPGLFNSGMGLGILGNTFSFSVQDDTSVLSAKLDYDCVGRTATTGGTVVDAATVVGVGTVIGAGGGGNTGTPPQGKKGMTWTAYSYPQHQNSVSGSAAVGCSGQGASTACDAYHGDQMCTVKHPVLCSKRMGLPAPLADANNPSSYPTHWSGNVIATTPAVAPASDGLTTLAAVNQYCATQFGPGWEVAEFHDGNNEGWSIRAYGSVGQPKARFWVHIKNQPANCW